MNRVLSVRPILLFLLYFIPNSTLFSQEEIKVACVGDSITYGFGLLNKKNNYPSLLETSLPEQWVIRNFGVNGACAGSGFPDSYAKTGMPEEIRQWNPDIILILLGSNDSKVENWKSQRFFIRSFNKILNSITNSKTEVIIQLPPPSGFNTFGIRDSIIRQKIYPALRDYAEKHHYPVVDFSYEMENRHLLFLDNVHPNKWGYNIMKEKILEKLKEIHTELSQIIPS